MTQNRIIKQYWSKPRRAAFRIRPQAHIGFRPRVDQAVRDPPHHSALDEAPAWLAADANRQRGEFVLIVSGALPFTDNGEGARVLKLLLDEGLSVSQAAKLAHVITGVAKKAMYELALRLRG
jgi:hypothetical protein